MYLPSLAQMCPCLACNGFDIESETSEDADAQHNIWKRLLGIFTLQEGSFCYKMIWKIGSYAGSLYLATLLWTSSTPSQLEEYDVWYTNLQTNSTISKGYQLNEGQFRTKCKGHDAGLKKKITEYSTHSKHDQSR